MAGRAAFPGGVTEGSGSPRSRPRRAPRFPRMRISRPRRRPRRRACPRTPSSAMSVHRLEEATRRQRRPATSRQGWQQSSARFRKAWSAGPSRVRLASNLGSSGPCRAVALERPSTPPGPDGDKPPEDPARQDLVSATCIRTAQSRSSNRR